MVEVGLDLQKGGGQRLVGRQPAIYQIAAKIIQFRPMGLIAPLDRAQSSLHERLPVMMGASRQGGHEEQTQLLDQVLQHVVGVGGGRGVGGRETVARSVVESQVDSHFPFDNGNRRAISTRHY